MQMSVDSAMTRPDVRMSGAYHAVTNPVIHPAKGPAMRHEVAEANPIVIAPKTHCTMASGTCAPVPATR